MKIFVFAYLDKNLGDDLMIRMLASELKEHELYIDCANPILTRGFNDLNNVKFINFEKGIKEKFKHLQQFDGYITIGGSIFIIRTNKDALQRLLKRFILLKLLKITGMKIATIGCNLGSFGSKFCKWVACWELSCSDLVTVRDSYSYKILSKTRKKKYLMKFDDIVMNYPIIEGKSDKMDIVQNCLGISVYRARANSEINLLNYKKMAELADEYIIRTGGKVLLFAFDTENENDLSAAYNIIEIAKNKTSIEIIAYCNKPEYIIDNMKRCTKFIATRFHSAILAIRLGIEFIPISYSNKMNNMLDDIGYNGLCINLNEINNFDISKIMNFLENTDENLKVYVPSMAYNGINHLKAVRAYLENDKNSLSLLLNDIRK